jgi:hypothetical protein
MSLPARVCRHSSGYPRLFVVYLSQEKVKATFTSQKDPGSSEPGLTFEKVWEMFQESDRKFQEMSKETDRKFQETDRQMKATDKRVGELTNRYGEISEHMIIPNLMTSFNALGFSFTMAGRRKIEDTKHGIFTEVDAFLENGDCVMIVEMKTYLRTDHIDDHVKRMEKLRTLADYNNDKRKYYGAIAGLMMSQSEKTYALKKGFYVLEPVGETFTITAPKSPGEPKAW